MLRNNPMRMFNKLSNKLMHKRIDKLSIALNDDIMKEHIKKKTPNIILITRPKLIISLTSYGERLHSVSATIRSIMLQTVAPDKIILYIDEENNDVILPDDLVELEHFGLEIVRGVENIKCHNKYYYSMQDYTKSIIVTVDDDCIYPSNMISSLLEGYQKNPGAIIARRVHRITRDADETILPYVEWDHEWCFNKNKPAMNLFGTGCAGVLYPPHVLPECCFEKNAIRKNALTADDVWLKCVEVAYKIPTVNVGCTPYSFLTIQGTQTNALKKTNVGSSADNGNDRAIRNCMQHFGLKDADFFINGS